MYWGFHEDFLRERDRSLERRLEHAALRRERRRLTAPTDPVVLRLCCVDEEDSLHRLAALEGVPTPEGRHLVAEVEGIVVAARPLDGGRVLTDPTRRTAHLLPLLELRAKQLGGRRVTLPVWWNRRAWGRA
jgi:hypothetical protein